LGCSPVKTGTGTDEQDYVNDFPNRFLSNSFGVTVFSVSVIKMLYDGSEKGRGPLHGAVLGNDA